MTSSNPLDSHQFPLHGVRLIEASAGTGKTYTIAALYLRLILDHGTEKLGLTRPLLPPDILVVTFTEASTKELRDRIRARLTAAAQYFRGITQEADPFLKQLAADFPRDQWLSYAHRLEVAANWMDESAVYTIHGWCNRMLKQHAFASGSLFEQTLNNDDTDLLYQVVCDYWRTHFYPMSVTQCLGVSQLVRSPQALAKKVARLLAETEALALTESIDIQQLAQEWEKWELERQSLQQKAAEQWLNNLGPINALFDQAIQGDWLNQSRYKSDTLVNKLSAMTAWAQGLHRLKATDVVKFAQYRLISGLKKNAQQNADQFALSAFIAIEALEKHHSLENAFTSQIIPHAIQWIRDHYADEKRRRAQINYDDMLTSLDKALQGNQGQALAELIRAQYPVAMIDEFQDTDPVQYRIFSTLYPAEQANGLGCFMIGDPKQAIYSFRGADIFTYLKAHQATLGQHYTLDTNYRSTSSLVAAVNRVFEVADQRPDSMGAFQFKSGEHNPLPFVSVDAEGRRERWLVNGQSVPALTIWCDVRDQAVSFTEYQNGFAEAMASEIVRLLNSAKAAQTGFWIDGHQGQSLRPADIAILVRSAQEAKIVRRALMCRGLASVYLSERDSIYASNEAGDLLIWLQAMADPRHEARLRAAISTASFGFSYQQLQQLVADEQSWEVHLERFVAYQQRWLSEGILPAIRQLIFDYNLHGRGSDRQSTERSLTNLLHLAELLQHASVQFEGELALIRHLSDAIADVADQSGEDQILRLESDADLIQIVTIHKSKGLEYPLVFLPFIASFKEPRGDYYRYHNADRDACIDLDKSDDSKTAAYAERLQEDLRLVYVALTRARFACWLGMAPIKSGSGKDCQLEKSAIGYLLNWQAKTPASDLRSKLLDLRGECQDIAILPLPSSEDVVYQFQRDEIVASECAVATAPIADRWWIASYSALAVSSGSRLGKAELHLEPESSQDSSYVDEVDGEKTIAEDITTEAGVHRLPKGAGPGLLVHALLEQMGRTGFHKFAQESSKQVLAISNVFTQRHWQDHYPVLETALQAWLNLPLVNDSSAICLAHLQPGSYQVEMEFYIGVAEQTGLPVQAIDSLVTQAVFPNQARPAAKATCLNGLLKGFIDLVFVHQDRYYIADYKFNHLGDRLADYAPVHLEAAMLAKRYDLQMVLYLLALHRLLKLRLGSAYEYERHMGGGIYWFLRGAEHSGHGQVHILPPRALLEQLDSLFRGEAGC